MRAGFTLIEMTVTLAVAAVLFAAAVVGIGALTGAEARASAGQLAGAAQSLFDQAALTGKTCRLVFDLPSQGGRGRQGLLPRRVRGEGPHHLPRPRRLPARRGRQARGSGSAPGGGAGTSASSWAGAPETPRAWRSCSPRSSSGWRDRRPSAASPTTWSSRASCRPRCAWRSGSAGSASTPSRGRRCSTSSPRATPRRPRCASPRATTPGRCRLEPLTGRVSVVAEALEVPRS